MLVDYIEEKNIYVVRGDNAYRCLLDEVISRIPMTSNATGRADKAQAILARAIMLSLWCGWLSKAKGNRGAYPEGMSKFWKKLMDDAFKVGETYAKDRK